MRFGTFLAIPGTRCVIESILIPSFWNLWLALLSKKALQTIAAGCTATFNLSLDQNFKMEQEVGSMNQTRSREAEHALRPSLSSGLAQARNKMYTVLAENSSSDTSKGESQDSMKRTFSVTTALVSKLQTFNA